jgi:menaquinone-dependent protoporphyrinogen oxidase
MRLPIEVQALLSGAGQMTILVAFASRGSSTREVAERIAGRLRTCGHHVTLTPVTQASHAGAYGAVVLGSAVYDGAWPWEATSFVQEFRDLLASRPVWLFSMGTFDDCHPVVGRFMTSEPRGIGEIVAAIRPRDYRVFAGVIDGSRWPWWGRLVLRAFGGRSGDNRNWPEIDNWSDGIGRALQHEAGDAKVRRAS